MPDQTAHPAAIVPDLGASYPRNNLITTPYSLWTAAPFCLVLLSRYLCWAWCNGPAPPPQALLEEPWPRELLEHDKCRPVWLARTAAEVPLELPFEPAAGTSGPPATAAHPVVVQTPPQQPQQQQPQPQQQPHANGHIPNPSQRVQYGGHGPRSTGGGNEGIPYTASRLGTPSAVEGTAGPATATAGSAVSGWATGTGVGNAGGGSGRALVGGSGRMNSLRRILAWQGSSKRRVHSLNGTPDGAAGAGSADAAMAAVLASHDGGGCGASTSGAATSDATPGDMSPPGTALDGRGTPSLLPASRILTVGDALRAMWREVSVANDPWGGSGNVASGAAMRWQGMKAALSLRLPAAIPNSMSRPRQSASGISIGGAASVGSGPTSPPRAGSLQSVSRDGWHLAGGGSGGGGTGSRQRMAAAAAGPVAEARLLSTSGDGSSDSGGVGVDGGADEDIAAAELVGITIGGGEGESSGEEGEEVVDVVVDAGAGHRRTGELGDRSGSQRSLARRVQSESANKSHLAQVAGSTLLVQRALSGTAGAELRARRRAAAAAAAAAARMAPVAAVVNVADVAGSTSGGAVAATAAAASGSTAHSVSLARASAAMLGAGHATDAPGNSTHSFSGSRLGSKTFGRRLLSALVEMAFGPGSEQGAASGAGGATEDSYAEGNTGGTAAQDALDANGTAGSSRRTTLGNLAAPAAALSAPPAPAVPQAMASAPAITVGRGPSSRALPYARSMARSEGTPSYGAGRLAPAGSVGVDAAVVSAEQCTLVRRGLAVRIGKLLP